MTRRYDVLVLGAGVVGLSAARCLVGRGADVGVLDPTGLGGRGARAAAGVIIPSVRLVGDTTMLAFVRTAQAALTADLAELEVHAGPLHRDLGIVRTVSHAPARDRLDAAAAAAGYDLGTWHDGADLADVEPALYGTSELGGFVADGCRVVDADGYVTALLHDATRAGVDVRLGEGAVNVDDHTGGVTVRTNRGRLRADHALVAAGAWSGAMPGLTPVPVRPLRGQMLTVVDPAHALARIICNDRGGYVAPFRGQAAVVGATEEDAGFDDHATPAGLLHLCATIQRTFPALSGARVMRAWAGLRAATPDGRPLLGRHPGASRTLLASGHGGQGILTAALSGRMVAGLLDGHPHEFAAAFAPDRVQAPT